MNPQAELEERVGDREQQADAVLGEHVDDGELLGGAIVNGDFGRHVADELAARALHVMRRGDQRRDILLAGDDAFEIVLDAQPAVVFQRHRDLAHLMRDAKHVHRDTVGARGDSRGQDVEIVGGQRARDHREQSRPIARHDDELAELEVRKMPDAADQRAVVERAHQIEMQLDVVFGHGEEIAVGHLVEERGDVGFRSGRGEQGLAHIRLDRGETARGIDRLAIALLEHLERAQVEIAQQHVAPVVIDLGRDRAHVGVGQQVERLQAIDRADSTRKFRDRGLIVEVTFLRDLRHHQMVAHEEHDEIDFLVVQAEALRHFRGQARAALMMVVAVAFADVVQQQREEYQRQMRQLARNFGEQGRWILELARAQAFELAHRHQRMPIDGIDVVEVVQNARVEIAELGDNRAEHARQMHRFESFGDALARGQNRHQRLGYARVFAHRVVDQTQHCRAPVGRRCPTGARSAPGSRRKS